MLKLDINKIEIELSDLNFNSDTSIMIFRTSTINFSHGSHGSLE